MKKNIGFISSVVAVLSLIACQINGTRKSDGTKASDIEHVVVIYLENHSFYNLFADFPGVDHTLPTGYKGQRNSQGQLYEVLPRVTERGSIEPDSRFPGSLPNKPFLLDQFVKLSDKVPDPSHDFFYHSLQINDGKMDRFVELSGVGALVMGYHDMKESQLWRYAKEFTVADHFFQSVFGGSFINHIWLIAAQSPKYENAPANGSRAEFNEDGSVRRTGVMTADNFAVNTIQPFHPPFDARVADSSKRLPPLEFPTIGERLNEKKVSWAWYAGGWADILAGKNSGKFQYHHQPFSYFKKYAPDTAGRRDHLKDETDLFADIKEGRLPSVVFFKPIGVENAHPLYSEVASADAKMGKVIKAIRDSQYWSKTLVVVTFDENGGFWDPIAPPKIDRWGPGSRIPAIFVSPHVKRGFVDNTVYETVSILTYLEKRFGLEPLTDRDNKANPLSGIFQN